MIGFNSESRAFEIKGIIPTTGHASTSKKTTVLYNEGGAVTATIRYTLTVYEDNRTPAERKAARKGAK